MTMVKTLRYKEGDIYELADCHRILNTRYDEKTGEWILIVREEHVCPRCGR